jgi:hypothetical protein
MPSELSRLHRFLQRCKINSKSNTSVACICVLGVYILDNDSLYGLSHEYIHSFTVLSVQSLHTSLNSPNYPSIQPPTNLPFHPPACPWYILNFPRIEVITLNRTRRKDTVARGCAIKTQWRCRSLQYPVTAGKAAKTNQQVHHWQTFACGQWTSLCPAFISFLCLQPKIVVDLHWRWIYVRIQTQLPCSRGRPHP